MGNKINNNANQPMFKYLQIETTTYCNAVCWFCPNSEIATTRMTDKMLYGIVDSTRGLNVVYRPVGLGEPFGDSRMVKLCKYMKEDPTAQVEIHTNGELVTEKVMENVKDYVDVIRFSIDGFKKETFDVSRGIDFDIVNANAKSFLENAPNVEVQVRMINLPGTEDEQQDFLDYWNGIRKGCALITELYNHPWEKQTESLNLPCKKVYDEAFIYAKGGVHLCPWDFHSKSIIGNVKDDSIVNIWNGALYDKYRNFLADGRRDQIELCSRCDAVFPATYKKYI